jgi:periplasmic mercuric ion binding protein
MNRITNTVAAFMLSCVLSPAFAVPAVYSLRVDGLGCPFCAYGIEKNLNDIDGVEGIEVDIRKGMVFITMEEGKTLSEQAANEKVKDAGFTLRAFSKSRENH